MPTRIITTTRKTERNNAELIGSFFRSTSPTEKPTGTYAHKSATPAVGDENRKHTPIPAASVRAIWITELSDCATETASAPDANRTAISGKNATEGNAATGKSVTITESGANIGKNQVRKIFFIRKTFHEYNIGSDNKVL